jgi:hypothetical protein
MNARTRRSYLMGKSALGIVTANPDTDPGAAVAQAALERLTNRVEDTATGQRSGLVNVHAATAEKARLRKAMSVPIGHLARVGRAAAREVHELGSTFQFNPSVGSYVAFRTAARSMVADAETHREVLVKYGLSVPVLEELKQLLEQFDAAIELGISGRALHIGATKELDELAAEIVRTVRLMDGRNRQRFQGDPTLLNSWISASTIVGQPRSAPDASAGNGTTPAGGDVRSAA